MYKARSAMVLIWSPINHFVIKNGMFYGNNALAVGALPYIGSLCDQKRFTIGSMSVRGNENIAVFLKTKENDRSRTAMFLAA
jgi:hypothetical protein